MFLVSLCLTLSLPPPLSVPLTPLSFLLPPSIPLYLSLYLPLSLPLSVCFSVSASSLNLVLHLLSYNLPHSLIFPLSLPAFLSIYYKPFFLYVTHIKTHTYRITNSHKALFSRHLPLHPLPFSSSSLLVSVSSSPSFVPPFLLFPPSFSLSPPLIAVYGSFDGVWTSR